MKKHIYIIILSLILIGCITNAKYVLYTMETYWPTRHVEVYWNKTIDKEYREIGEVYVRLNKSTEENAISLLVDKAKEIGADGMIIMGERTEGAVDMPFGSMAVATQLRELYAIAIKYK